MGAINKYKVMSGYHWDNIKGANIHEGSEVQVWDAWVKGHPLVSNSPLLR